MEVTLNFNFNNVILDKQSEGLGGGGMYDVTSELR